MRDQYKQTNTIRRRARIFLGLFVLLASHFFPSTASAIINQQINYQGKLTNASGQAASDGNWSMTFKIYTVSTGGSPLWTETKTVTTSRGVFSTLLGSDTALNLDFSSDTYYLGVKVENDAEMSPRKRIGAVPQAFNSKNVIGDGLINLTGAPAGTSVSQGLVYINPASTTADYTLLGAAVGGVQKLRLNEAGNLDISGAFNGLSIASGTVTSGIWHGTAIGATYGGTGMSSYTTGDILYAGSSSTLTVLHSNVPAGNCLVSGGVGLAPTWGGCGAGGGASIGSVVNGATGGSVLFTDGVGALAEDNANFYWNNTNHFLGLGTASPSYRLDVAENLGVTSGWKQIARVSRGTGNNRGVSLGYVADGSADTAGFIASDGSTSTDLVFATASAGNTFTERARFTAAGDFGIGTSTPSQLFAVGATSQFSVSSSGTVNIAGLTTSKVVFTDAWDNLSSIGTVGLDQGGTGLDLSVAPAGEMLYTSGSGTFSALTVGTAGQCLVSTGSAPSWNSCSNGGISINNSIGGGTAGSVLFINGTGKLGQDNPYFFWNDSLRRLGLGNNTPQALLSVGTASQFQVNDSGVVNIAGLDASKVVFTDTLKNLTSTGTVGVGQGGTGYATYTTGDILYAGSSGSFSKLSTSGTNGMCIVSDGSIPRWDVCTNGIPIGSSVTNGGLAGSVLFIDNANNLAQDNDYFYWDKVFHKLGIGNKTPQALLAVGSSSQFRVDSGTVSLIGQMSLGTRTLGQELLVAGSASETYNAGYFSTDGMLLAQLNGGAYFGRVGLREQPLAGGNFGGTWNARGSSLDWRGVAVSSDGKYQTAVVYDDSIYTSSDYGATWTANVSAGTGKWVNVALSADGKFQTAIKDPGYFFVSVDYGQTWTQAGSYYRNGVAVALSADGKYQTIVAYGVYGSSMFFSSNYGATWSETQYTNPPYSVLPHWKSIAMSSDGRLQTAVVEGGGNIWLSTDYGATWTEKVATRNWKSIAMSADGKIQTAVVYGGQIYVSNDYGNGFYGAAGTNSHNWKAVAMSADGKIQTALEDSGQVYVSVDFGVTWTAKDSSRNWQAIALSADGRIQTATVSAGQIYTSYAGTTLPAGNFGLGTSSPLGLFSVGSASQFQIDASGNVSTSANVGLTALTASKVVFTDVSKNLTTTGTVGTSQGGTGLDLSLEAAGELLYTSGSGTLSKLTIGANGLCLVSNGSAPYWDTCLSGGISIGTPLVSATPGSVLFADASSQLGQDNAHFFWNQSGYRLELKSDTTSALPAGSLSAGGALVAQLEGGAYLGRVGVKERLLDTSSPGQTWVSKLTAGINWHGVAMSSDGKIQTAVAYNGRLYNSADYGETWSVNADADISTNKTWFGVAMSADGKVQTAVVEGGSLYTSSDYGQSWAPNASAGSRNWSWVALSADGKLQTAVVSPSGSIYTSSDFGQTWTANVNAGVRNWYRVALSSDGKIQTATVEPGLALSSQLYVSTDNGQTWTAHGPSQRWHGIAMSADGKIQTAVAYNNGQIYISSDYGTNWTAAGSNRQWYGIAMSSDGKIQTAVAANAAQLSTSTDYGQHWSDVGAADEWNSVAMSADGSVQTAVVDGGYLYTSRANTYLPGGKFGIGTASPLTNIHVVSPDTVSIVMGDSYINTDKTTGFVGRKARGTASAPLAVQTDDYLANLGGRGYGATGFSASSMGYVSIKSAENWTDSAQGTYIAFETTANGGTTLSEKVRIADNGSVGIGTTTPAAALSVGATSQFQVTSTGVIAAAAGITSSGTITFSGLTASKAVFTDASKNLTSTGTLGTDQGGTGLTTYATGELLYASAANTLSKLTVGTAGQCLTSNGTIPAWSACGAGTMAIGGAITSATAGSVLYVNASGQLAQDNANFFWDATNHRLGLGGTTTPAATLSVGATSQFQVSSTGVIAAAAGITSSGTITFSGFSNNGGLLYTDASGVLAQTAVGTLGQCLTSAGGGSPTWSACGAGGSMAIGGAITSATAGSVLYVNASGQLAQDNANFFWDATNHRLGLGGTTTPSATLSVGATSQFQVSSVGNLSLTSANTTQTTTSSAIALNVNSLTTGTGLYAASSTLTSGKLLDLQVSGTAAAASQTALNILTTGTNGTGGITTYGAQISNTHNGATSTNVALSLSASGGTTANYALVVPSGNVGIGTTTPSTLFSVGSSSTFTVNNSGNVNLTKETLSCSSTTQATTSSCLSLSANSLTSGTGFYTASSSLTTGKLIDIQISGTDAQSGQAGLNVTLSGANSNAGQDTYGIYASNTHTGTTPYNYAGYFNASVASSASYAYSGYFVTSTVAGASGFGLYSTVSGGGSNIGVDSIVSGGASNYGFYTNVGGSSGSTNYGGYFRVSNSTGTNTAGYFSASGASATNYGLIVASGSVGIGNTSPSALFSVGSSSQFQINSSGNLSLTSANTTQTTTSSAIALNVNSLTTGTGLYAASSSLTSGKLLDLQISGTAAAASQTGLNIVTTGANATGGITTYGAQITNSHSGGTSTNVALNLSASGGTTANYSLIADASVKLTGIGAGALSTDASGNVTASSDERLKNIDGSFMRGLEAIKQIQPINYHWNEISGLDQTHQYTGFSAQNVLLSIPEAVAVGPNGYYTFNDRPVTAALVNAVKEQQGMIDQQSTDIQNLVLQTDTNVATVTGLQQSVDANLVTISSSFATVNQALTALQTATQTLSQTMTNTTTTLETHTTQIATLQSQFGTIQAELQALMDFSNALQLDQLVMKDVLGNVDIGQGKIKAAKVETGALVLVVDAGSDAPTIGTGTLCPIAATDVDGDGNDDCSGLALTDPAVTDRDGKSVTIKTKAISTKSHVFLTPKVALPEPLAVTGMTDQKRFTVSTNTLVTQSVSFDWWIVDEQH